MLSSLRHESVVLALPCSILLAIAHHVHVKRGPASETLRVYHDGLQRIWGHLALSCDRKVHKRNVHFSQFLIECNAWAFVQPCMSDEPSRIVYDIDYVVVMLGEFGFEPSLDEWAATKNWQARYIHCAVVHRTQQQQQLRQQPSESQLFQPAAGSAHSANDSGASRPKTMTLEQSTRLVEMVKATNKTLRDQVRALKITRKKALAAVTSAYQLFEKAGEKTQTEARIQQ